MFALIKMKVKKNFGFTLIEILVVISIMGILLAFATNQYTQAERQARDSQRKSDLNQYRVALENYASANNGSYPEVICLLSGEHHNIGPEDGLCPVSVPLTNPVKQFAEVYLSGSCLNDVREDESYYYFYCSNKTNYSLGAKLETGGFYEVCSNGKSGIVSGNTQPDLFAGACTLN